MPNALVRAAAGWPAENNPQLSGPLDSLRRLFRASIDAQAIEPASQSEESFMNVHVSRRSIVAATAIAAGMSTALATAALAASLDDEHPDAHLFRLDQEMAEAEAQMDRAEKACRRAGKKAEKAERLLPPRPADWTEPSMPAGIREIMAGLQVRDLASPEKHPAPLRAWNKARDEQRAAHRALQEAYLDKVAEVNRETGADDADDAYSARADEFFNVVDRILATPASTLQGIAIKIRASEKTDCSFAARNGAFRSIAADIKRLAGEARDG